METRKSSSVCLIFFLTFMFCSLQQALSQNKLAGNWEGVFMSQFSTQLTLSCDSLNNYGGSIKMFAGENLIQDDPIEQINLSNNKLTFYIPAKETTFQGIFNEQMTELSGNFIFPDALHKLGQGAKFQTLKSSACFFIAFEWLLHGEIGVDSDKNRSRL